VLVWDLTTGPRKVASGPVRLAEARLEDLGRADATVAFRSMAELIGTPDETIALFRMRVSAPPPVKADVIEGLIVNLSNDKYAVREKATKELEKLGSRARPYLVKAQATKLDGETTKRLQRLVDLLEAPVRDPEQLRAGRAVEVLERIGTPAALELLEQWSRGAAGARLSQNALEASKRVSLRLGVKTP
jgi:hypothetical protein